MKAAIVVAHPDDETLFGAGWMLKNPDDEFTVICCSVPRRDPIRLTQFKSAIGILRASHFVVLNSPDRGGKRPLDLSHLESDELNGFDYIVTHNELGEYGNPHHVQVHKHVKENFSGSIYCFGYALQSAYQWFTLSKEEAATKLRALQCYDFATAVDKKPKWEALIDRYFEKSTEKLSEETYVRLR